MTSNAGSLLVHKSDVPVYLCSGEFYLSLSDDDTEQISVPSNTLKEDTVINNNNDLHHLLSSLRFWGVGDVMEEVIQYCLSTLDESPCTETLKDFKQDFPFVSVLTTILSVDDKRRMLSAVKSGMLEIVRNLPESGSIRADCCLAAAEAGHLDILQYLQQRGCVLNASVLDAALRGGKGLACVQYLKDQGVRWPRKTLVTSLVAGSRDCLHYALQDNCEWELFGGSELCEDKHVEELMYAFQHGLQVSRCLAEAAALNGAIQCLQILHGFNCPWDCVACELAARHGHLECLQYLHEQGCPWDVTVSTAAAETGQLDCLKYLHEHGCPWSASAFISPMSSGNIEIIAYLYDNGCPSGVHLCANAATRGNLKVLKFLHERGCPWDGDTMYWAVNSNYLECVQYALQHGCPANGDCSTIAAIKGNLTMLQLLHQAGAPWNEVTCAEAACNGHLDCLRYLRENGCPWSECLCSDAAKNGHLDCLEYAHSQGCPLSEDVGLYAAVNGHLDCLQYAHKHGVVAWHKDIFRETLENEQLECLLYLLENGCPIDTEACAVAYRLMQCSDALDMVSSFAPELF